MPCAAVLGAKQVVVAGPGRLEPGARVAAGDDVLLGAEGGDVEVVDDVLRGHDEFHRLTDRDVVRHELVARIVRAYEARESVGRPDEP